MSGEDSLPLIEIILVSDGRPGHFRLSEGIVLALSRLRPVHVTRLEVPRRSLPGPLAALVSNVHFTPARTLKTVYGLDLARDIPAQRPQIIVSAGAETLTASVALARAFGAANVHYGSLRAFRPTDFALVLTSYRSKAHLPRHAYALKPQAFDPDTLPQPSGDPPLAAVLVGGPTRGIAYSSRDWTDLIERLKELSAATGMKLLISTSRRTPAEATRLIEALAAEPGGPVARFIDGAKPDAPSLSEILGPARAVIATADSSSMVSEAVWARRPVLAVAPRDFNLTPDERSYRQGLAEAGLVAEFTIAELGPKPVAEALARLKPLARNPLAELADLLADRILKEFLVKSAS